MLDRTWLHTIFGVEMSLVLWLLSKTIGISWAFLFYREETTIFFFSLLIQIFISSFLWSFACKNWKGHRVIVEWSSESILFDVSLKTTDLLHNTHSNIYSLDIEKGVKLRKLKALHKGNRWRGCRKAVASCLWLWHFALIFSHESLPEGTFTFMWNTDFSAF